MELTVLGCSGSYGGPTGGACSGYLVRSGDTTIWMDCGNGTFSNLQQHVQAEELTAVVITHEHPDHAVDLYGLHILLRYGLEREELPVYAPAHLAEHLGALVEGDWGNTFDWRPCDESQPAEIGDVGLRFSRTDHPPPTYAVELATAGKRMIYTADTGPGWDVSAFDPGADLVLSEATYLHGEKPAEIHLSAREAGEMARAAGARRLMLTHLWPRLDRHRAVMEGSDAYGESVVLAAPHLVTQI
ncbi:MAG TPA: MBL fold metallo-hydrolase [Acidimicrobiia bacterium]|nr:MBL fold metallo-hydrolase [Acidimicrobiia bacterium]